jgi:hypothetical protein
MTDSIQAPIDNLADTIISSHKAIIFLGAGSSIEGKQGDKQYPCFEQLIDKILADFKYNPIKDWDSKKKVF